MRAICVQNYAHAGPALIAGDLEAAGVSLVTVMAPEADLASIMPEDADLVIVLGSPNAVYERDRLPWIDAEIDLVRRFLGADRMVFGICFGAQILATALGSTVRATGKLHCGWERLETPQDDAEWAGPWFRWHGDSFDPPADARVLASAGGLVQAFEHGRHLGVAFHPEVDAPTLRAWVSDARTVLTGAGIAPEAFLAEGIAGIPGAAANRRWLVRQVLERARR